MKIDFSQLQNLLPAQSDQLYYVPNFYSSEEAKNYFLALKNEVEWEQGSIRIFGKEIKEPRLTAWYGEAEASYSYSGQKRIPKSWLPVLFELKKVVEQACASKFNSVLLNYYRHGNESMGWHRDNEKELGLEPCIASLSFGAERSFLVREYKSKANKIEIVPSSGSLLIMRGEMQNHWEHALPKRKKKFGRTHQFNFSANPLLTSAAMSSRAWRWHAERYIRLFSTWGNA